MKSPRRTTLASSVSSGAALSFASVALSILVVVLVVLGGLGCAGVKNAPPAVDGLATRVRADVDAVIA